MMAAKLSRDDLMSLEQYAQERSDFRQKVMLHKKHRRVYLGEAAALYFEDRLTMQYQVQEMLRIEKIFEDEGIQEELDAYNPLVPDGQNLKATFMLEYKDPADREKALPQLIGIEDKVWVQVKGFDKVYAIADEDMERENQEKTSAVHFMRFELAEDMVKAAKEGTDMAMGIDHENYSVTQDPIPSDVRDSLVEDLEV